MKKYLINFHCSAQPAGKTSTILQGSTAQLRSDIYEPANDVHPIDSLERPQPAGRVRCTTQKCHQNQDENER